VDGARHTPIVALTANALSEQIERCMQAGMDAFLSKPIEPAKLRDVLARYSKKIHSVAGAAGQGAAR
jgi:CheY-like chemotaxis protein